MFSFSFVNKPITVQIIKRLYRSPSEVIHGFDVDSSCILINHFGEILATERFIYATINRCNFINFDRLSPSYEHRLNKNINRGYNVWIPQIEYMKSQSVIDINALKRKGCDLILRKLLFNKDYQYVESRDIRSDYENIKAAENYNELGELNDDTRFEFKKLNPGEQIINTFHRTILEDIKLWYPKLPEQGFVETIVLPILDDTNYQEVTEIIKYEIIFARNLVRKKRFNLDNIYSLFWSKILFDQVFDLLPDCHIYGDIPHLVIGGNQNFSPQYNLFQLFIFTDKLDENTLDNITYELLSTYYTSKVAYSEFYPTEEVDREGKIISKRMNKEDFYLAYDDYNNTLSDDINFQKMIDLNASTQKRYYDTLSSTNAHYDNRIAHLYKIHRKGGVFNETEFSEKLAILESEKEDEIRKIKHRHGNIKTVPFTTYDFPRGSLKVYQKDGDYNYMNEKEFKNLKITFIHPDHEEAAIKELKISRITPDVLTLDRRIYTTEEHFYQIKYNISSDDKLSEILPYPAIENYTVSQEELSLYNR